MITKIRSLFSSFVRRLRLLLQEITTTIDSLLSLSRCFPTRTERFDE